MAREAATAESEGVASGSPRRLPSRIFGWRVWRPDEVIFIRDCDRGGDFRHSLRDHLSVCEVLAVPTDVFGDTRKVALPVVYE